MNECSGPTIIWVSKNQAGVKFYWGFVRTEYLWPLIKNGLNELEIMDLSAYDHLH